MFRTVDLPRLRKQPLTSLTCLGNTDCHPRPRSAAQRIVGSIYFRFPNTLFNRLFERSNMSRSCRRPGAKMGEPFGEEPPGVWGSPDGHLPWETALREPSRLVQTGAGPTSHRGGHWFDPSIAHQVRGYVGLHQRSRAGRGRRCGWPARGPRCWCGASRRTGRRRWPRSARCRSTG